MGHSLGGGTAALLTYILRERQPLGSTKCVSFAPGMVLLVWCYCMQSPSFIFYVYLDYKLYNFYEVAENVVQVFEHSSYILAGNCC